MDEIAKDVELDSRHRAEFARPLFEISPYVETIDGPNGYEFIDNTPLIDLLTDLRHLADTEENLDFEDAIRMSLMHYEAEKQ